jgi:hypothetical protein
VACTTILANIYFSPTYFSKAVNEVFVRPNFMEEFNCEGAIMRLTESYKNGLTISAGSKFAPHLIQRELHLFPTYKQANLIIFDPDDYTNKSDLLYINNLLENQDYITTDYKKSEYESPHLQNSLPPIILSKKPGTPGEGDINPDDVESFPQQYFGAVVKYKKYSPFLLYGGKPEFEIYRFDNDGLSPDQLKANLRDYLSRKSELSSWNDSDEIYIIPMPYDYPNTLDEYFTELYVSTFNMRLYEENQGISE